jgi:hypothetical protein
MYLMEHHASHLTIKGPLRDTGKNEGGDIGKRLVVAGVFGRLAVPVLVETLLHGSWANRWLPADGGMDSWPGGRHAVRSQGASTFRV